MELMTLETSIIVFKQVAFSVSEGREWYEGCIGGSGCACVIIGWPGICSSCGWIARIPSSVPIPVYILRNLALGCYVSLSFIIHLAHGLQPCMKVLNIIHLIVLTQCR